MNFFNTIINYFIENRQMYGIFAALYAALGLGILLAVYTNEKNNILNNIVTLLLVLPPILIAFLAGVYGDFLLLVPYLIFFIHILNSKIKSLTKEFLQ